MTGQYPSIKKITAYLNGELSDKEANEIINWYNQLDESKKELDHLEIIWSLAERLDLMEKIDKQKAKSIINFRIEPLQSRWKLYLKHFQKVAAILILPVMLLSAWLLFFHSEKENSTKQEFVAAYGIRSTLLLPDGSKVWLNSGSKLKYGEDFNHDHRTVYLTGEAFFNVTSNKAKPFDVVTEHFTVRAVGTEFNVFAYGDNEFETSLEKGSVQLFQSRQAGKEPLLEMKPGQRAMYAQGKVLMSEGDVTRFSAWREGKLIFKNTSMQEAIPKLERWFNVDIELKDPELLEYRFTAIFKNETIQQALEMLSFSSPIQYKIVPGEKQQDEAYAKSKIEINVKNK